MAEHECLVTQLSLIAKDPAKLDSRARKDVLDATISCSAKLLSQPSTDQSGALNEPHVQPIYHLPFQTGDMDTSADTVPPECDSFPGDHETLTSDPWATDFSQQSTENLLPSFVPHYEPESPNHSPMGIYSDQQYIQNAHCPTIEMGTPFDWSTSFPNHFPSMPGTIARGSLSDSYRMPDLTDEIYNPLALHPTSGLWNDLNPITSFGSSANTTTIPDSMTDVLTIDLFNSSHNSSYLNDIGHIPQHLVPSAIDQLEPGFDHLNSSLTRPVAHLDVDPCIFREPVGTSTFLRVEEPPTPRTFQRFALHGRITTPESYLAITTYDTVSAFIKSGAGFDYDLPWDQQQRLCGELKARNVRPLPVRSESGKFAKAIRKKKAPSPEERRRIAETRRIGACYLCNRDRRKCFGPEGSCNYCVKTVGSLLASHICLTGLQIYRSKFHIKISFASPRRVRYHQRERCTTIPIKRSDIVAIRISTAFWITNFKDEAGSLLAPLQHHTASYELDRLEDSIDAFFSAYCDVSPCLPMRNCVEATLRMVYGDDAVDRRYSWRFLRQPTIELIREIESELLGTLDEHMNSESNRGFPNPTMLGLCIRRLSLYYRRNLIYSDAFEREARRGKGLPNVLRLFPERRESFRSMYDGCISAYSKVYHKGKSPYSLKWRLQDHIEEFGNDSMLVQRFYQIMEDERRFCEGIDENDEDDKVLRKLFLNTKQRGEKSWSG